MPSSMSSSEASSSEDSDRPPVMVVEVPHREGHLPKMYLVALVVDRGPYDLMIRFRPQSEPPSDGITMKSNAGDDGWHYGVRVHSTIDGDVDLIEPLTPWPWGDEDGKEPVEDMIPVVLKGINPPEDEEAYRHQLEMVVPGTPGEDYRILKRMDWPDKQGEHESDGDSLEVIPGTPGED
ncbi:hypothetical protein NLI96_g13117 [Meripilus lineatus]|uniref:Uncharacterized protein n=1 Tax=Meripilus lineatus TaxID=2056292 RepID=A0AAD5UNL0_9APHY|nr:hypothetical protein NLI96_g13117 [Physisporinus lineatus]